MIDILESYISQSIKPGEPFSTGEGLKQKADAQGHLLAFRGNTAVFLLDKETKEEIEKLREELYAAAPALLAERLKTDSFHMTLHDLVNGPPDTEGLSGAMADAEGKARAILRDRQEREPLAMTATWMFNMVNTSIVLGLRPADAGSWQRLDGLYTALNAVKPLDYAMTPHVTLAYFRPGAYSAEAIEPLRRALRPVALDVTLHMKNLVLQDFSDMNHYKTIE